MSPFFESPTEVTARLAEVDYLAAEATATTVYLAGVLGKPLLIEGPAGVGKTELAKAVATAAVPIWYACSATRASTRRDLRESTRRWLPNNATSCSAGQRPRRSVRPSVLSVREEAKHEGPQDRGNVP